MSDFKNDAENVSVISLPVRRCYYCSNYCVSNDANADVCDRCKYEFFHGNKFNNYKCKICREQFKSKYPSVSRYCVNCYVKYVRGDKIKNIYH